MCNDNGNAATPCIILYTAPAPQALYQGLQQLAGRMEVQLEMHVNEAPFARSFILSDCDLARVGAASCCHVCDVEKRLRASTALRRQQLQRQHRSGIPVCNCIVRGLLYLQSSVDTHVSGWPAVLAPTQHADSTGARHAAAADCGSAALAGHHLAARQPPDVLQHLAGKRFGAVCITCVALDL